MINLNIERLKEKLIKDEDKIILAIGFILVAILSFGAGKLSEVSRTETPIVFQDANCQNNLNSPAPSSIQNNVQDQTDGKIIGNKNSRIYHMPGGAFYDKISAENRVYFSSEEEAQKAGYRKAKN